VNEYRLTLSQNEAGNACGANLPSADLFSTFLDQNSSSHLVPVGWGYLFKKAQGSVVSNWIEMKFGKNVLRVNRLHID